MLRSGAQMSTGKHVEPTRSHQHHVATHPDLNAAVVATVIGAISDPYEPPERPELTIDTSHEPIEASVARIVAELERHIARN